MILDQIIENLKPFSALYGTGSVLVDLLILSGTLSMLFMFLVVTKVANKSTGSENRVSYRGHKPSYAFKQEVANLQHYVENLCAEMQVMYESSRNDNSQFLKEMNQTKRLVEDVKRAQDIATGYTKLQGMSAPKTPGMRSPLLESAFIPE